jgi:hypothetical protein
MKEQFKQIQMIVLAVCIPLLMSACASTPKQNPTVQYQCEQGTELSVVFNHTYVSIVRGGRSGMHRVEKRLTGATVTLADGTQRELTAQRVTVGFSASDGRYTLSGKDGEALWSTGRMAGEKCKVVPL